MSTRFPLRLSLSPCEGAEDRPRTRDGRSTWVLDTAFVYVPVGGQSIVVPAGFVTDLASVPRILTNIVPADGPWVKAAVIHDYLYATHGINGLYTRKQADGILREAMGVLGVSPFYRTVIYSGVRVGGWKGWGS